MDMRQRYPCYLVIEGVRWVQFHFILSSTKTCSKSPEGDPPQADQHLHKAQVGRHSINPDPERRTDQADDGDAVAGDVQTDQDNRIQIRPVVRALDQHGLCSSHEHL